MGPSAFDRANSVGPATGSAFARWCARGRPPVDRLLLALAGQFHQVDEARALDRLDDLARPAFGIATLPLEDGARRLIEAIGQEGGMLSGAPGDPDGLMLDRVLESGRGRPELLAAVYLEVARRAGMSLAVVLRAELVRRLRGRRGACAGGPGELRPARRANGHAPPLRSPACRRRAGRARRAVHGAGTSRRGGASRSHCRRRSRSCAARAAAGPAEARATLPRPAC